MAQQFTLQERDIETGLDYFLARSYSPGQGRFTSADEFTGGAHALQSFTTTASANPTFYAAQYHYPLGNPLPYVDPDGHTPCCVDQEALVNGATDVVVGADKTVANTWIAMGNFTKAFVGGIPTEPFRPTNTTQAVTMVITEDVSFFAGVLIGRANVGGVAISESQTTTAMTTRMTNASAVNTANQLQSLPRASRPNAAGAATAATGETYTATSGRGTLHPKVKTMLDNIDPSQRSKFHGACCEPKLISQMMNDGVNPQGATISVVRVRPAGNPRDATPMDPCSTCSLLLNAINKT